MTESGRASGGSVPIEPSVAGASDFLALRPAKAVSSEAAVLGRSVRKVSPPPNSSNARPAREDEPFAIMPFLFASRCDVRIDEPRMALRGEAVPVSCCDIGRLLLTAGLTP